MLTGCETDTPQNTFDAKGEVAEEQRDLFYIAMWPALVIMILVGIAIVVAVLRFRERDPNAPPPKQTHGNTRLEITLDDSSGVAAAGPRRADGHLDLRPRYASRSGRRLRDRCRRAALQLGVPVSRGRPGRERRHSLGVRQPAAHAHRGEGASSACARST